VASFSASRSTSLETNVSGSSLVTHAHLGTVASDVEIGQLPANDLTATAATTVATPWAYATDVITPFMESNNSGIIAGENSQGYWSNCSY